MPGLWLLSYSDRPVRGPEVRLFRGSDAGEELQEARLHACRFSALRMVHSRDFKSKQNREALTYACRAIGTEEQITGSFLEEDA